MRLLWIPQMHSVAGSGNSLAIIYSTFSFRPRGIVWTGFGGVQEGESQAELRTQAVSSDLNIPTYCKHAPTLADFYSRELSPGHHVSIYEWRGAR